MVLGENSVGKHRSDLTKIRKHLKIIGENLNIIGNNSKIIGTKPKIIGNSIKTIAIYENHIKKFDKSGFRSFLQIHHQGP